MSEMQNPTGAQGAQSKKHARKRAERFWWAGALIWAGLVFWADSQDLLPQIGGADAWSWVFLGAGLYGLVSNLYYLTSKSTTSPQRGTGFGPVASRS